MLHIIKNRLQFSAIFVSSKLPNKKAKIIKSEEYGKTESKAEKLYTSKISTNNDLFGMK